LRAQRRVVRRLDEDRVARQRQRAMRADRVADEPAERLGEGGR